MNDLLTFLKPHKRMLITTVCVLALVCGLLFTPKSNRASEYAFATVAESGDTIEVGGTGAALLNFNGVQMAVALAAREGWQVHSVTPVVSGRSSSFQSSFGPGSGSGFTGTDFIVLLQR